MLHALNWGDDARRAELRERIELAKEQRYDPWSTIDVLRAELKAPRPQWARRVELKAGFDSGDIRRTVHFLSGESPEMPAYQLLRLVEKAPCPLYAGGMSLLGETAAHAALWIADVAPFWSVVTLLRAGASDEIVNELFDRATIAMLSPSRIEQLYTQLLRLVDGEIAKLVTATVGDSDALSLRALRVGMDVISRLALRLAPNELDALLTKLAGWLVARVATTGFVLAEPLGTLLSRVLESLPDNAVGRAAELLLPLPIYGEPGYHPKAHEQMWPEPFEGLLNRNRNNSSQTAKPAYWPEVWARLIMGIRSENETLRRRAFIRAYFLHLNHWLSEDEQSAFGEAVWSRSNPATGLPEIFGFRLSLVLHLPCAIEHDAKNILKRGLLNKELRPWKIESGGFNSDHVRSFRVWMNEVAHVFCHPAIASPGSIVLPLEASEAAELLKRLLAWWPTAIALLGDPKYSELPLGDFKLEPVVKEFCKALGESLLLYLPRGHELAAVAEQNLEQLISRGLSVARAIPGRLFQRAELLDSVVESMEGIFISNDAEQVKLATEAMSSWTQAARHSMIPAPPRSLIELLVARVMLRQTTSLDSVIACLVRLIDSGDGQITEHHEHLLFRALAQLANDTSPARLRERFEAGEIERVTIVEGLHTREWVALLAGKMAASFKRRGQPLPDVLVQWRKICEDDSLPEMRRAWEQSA